MVNFENKSRWQIRIITLVIFALGFAAGIFALNSYNLWFNATKSPTKHERYQEAFNQLNLTESQRVEVQEIVAEIRENIQQLRRESEPQMQEIRRRNDLRLQKVLTTEQWAKFQELREAIKASEK